jgi:hypothetical protein
MKPIEISIGFTYLSNHKNIISKKNMRKLSYYLPDKWYEFPFDDLAFLENLLESSKLINGENIDTEIYNLLYKYINDNCFPTCGQDGEDIEDIELDNYDSFYNDISIISEAKDIDEFQTNVDLIVQTIRYNL